MPEPASRAQITGAIDSRVNRAIESADIRKDSVPFDLLRALIGACNVACSPDCGDRRRRLVDMLIVGSRPMQQRKAKLADLESLES